MGQLLPFHDIAEMDGVFLFHATPVASMAQHPDLALMKVARGILTHCMSDTGQPKRAMRSCSLCTTFRHTQLTSRQMSTHQETLGT